MPTVSPIREPISDDARRRIREGRTMRLPVWKIAEYAEVDKSTASRVIAEDRVRSRLQALRGGSQPVLEKTPF